MNCTASDFDRAACAPASRTRYEGVVAMKAKYKIAAALIGSFAMGAGAATVLHAQAHVPTYVVAMVNVKDQDGYAKNFLPKVMPAIKENGGEYLAGGMNKTMSFAGEQPPNRVVII